MTFVPESCQPSAGAADLSVWDPLTETPISFRTVSDALIANLRLTHSFSAEIINLFLGVIHSPRFVARDVTLKTTQDIEDRVAEERKDIAHRRSLAMLSPSFPLDILEHVLDALFDDAPPFDDVYPSYDDNTKGFQSFHENRTRMFLSLSLVHRTWTPLCQARSTRLLDITAFRSTRPLLRLIRSPYVRSSTRQLCIRQDVYHSSHSDHQFDETYGMLLASLTNIHILMVSSCATPRNSFVPLVRIQSLLAADSISNLRHLHWDAQYGATHFVQLCEALKGLRSLRSLCLSCDNIFPDDDFRGNLTEICIALNRLCNLTKLSFSHWGRLHQSGENANTFLVEQLNTLPRCALPLETLSVHHVRGSQGILLHVIAWILRPLTSSTVTTLELDFDIIRHLNPSTADIESFLSTLDIRGLHSLYAHHANLVPHASLERFLSTCPNLHTLAIDDTSWDRLGRTILTMAVARLEITCLETPLQTRKDRDTQLAQSITHAHPRLSTLIVNLSYWSKPTLLPLTETQCKMKGIVLQTKYSLF